MINHPEIETLEDFIKFSVPEQVEMVNQLIQEGHSTAKVSTSLGADRTTIGNRFKKFGYRLIENLWMLQEGQEEPPKTAQEPKKVEQQPKQQVAKKNPRMEALEVYIKVHDIIVDIDVDDYDRTSISLAKSTNKKLNEFLTRYPLLTKQDYITYALEKALSEDSK